MISRRCYHGNFYRNLDNVPCFLHKICNYFPLLRVHESKYIWIYSVSSKVFAYIQLAILNQNLRTWIISFNVCLLCFMNVLIWLVVREKKNVINMAKTKSLYNGCRDGDRGRREQGSAEHANVLSTVGVSCNIQFVLQMRQQVELERFTATRTERAHNYTHSNPCCRYIVTVAN